MRKSEAHQVQVDKKWPCAWRLAPEKLWLVGRPYSFFVDFVTGRKDIRDVRVAVLLPHLSLRSYALEFLSFVRDIPRLTIGFDHHPGSQPHCELAAESSRGIKGDYPSQGPNCNPQRTMLTSDFFSTDGRKVSARYPADFHTKHLRSNLRRGFQVIVHCKV